MRLPFAAVVGCLVLATSEAHPFQFVEPGRLSLTLQPAAEERLCVQWPQGHRTEACEGLDFAALDQISDAKRTVAMGVLRRGEKALIVHLRRIEQRVSLDDAGGTVRTIIDGALGSRPGATLERSSHRMTQISGRDALEVRFALTVPDADGSLTAFVTYVLPVGEMTYTLAQSFQRGEEAWADDVARRILPTVVIEGHEASPVRSAQSEATREPRARDGKDGHSTRWLDLAGRLTVTVGLPALILYSLFRRKRPR